jgi:hypothetical protein
MKRTNWMLGSILGIVMTMPVACGGGEPVSEASPSPEGVTDSEWAIVPIGSTTSSDCFTEMLFEVVASEAIDFIAVEASEELLNEMNLVLYQKNAAEALERVDLAAVVASAMTREAAASSRTAMNAAESANATAAFSERAAVDRTSFVSSRSEAVNEASASRVASASATNTAATSLLQERETLVDQAANAAFAAEDAASASAFASQLDFGLGLFGGGAGFSTLLSSQDAEALEAAQAAEGASQHVLDRDLVSSTATQTAAANEAASETLFDRSLVAAEEVANYSEVVAAEGATTATEAAAVSSEAIVETAESVHEVLESSEILSQSALDRTLVLLTEDLASKNLVVGVQFNSSIQEVAVAAETAADAAGVQVLTGTVDGIFANALFPAALACTPAVAF